MKGLASTFDETEDVALRRTWMRTRSPLAKIISAAVFLVVLVSYDRRSVGAIFPMFAFPVVWRRWVVFRFAGLCARFRCSYLCCRYLWPQTYISIEKYVITFLGCGFLVAFFRGFLLF